MKTLLIGLGQIGLGLIVPIFKKAGYEIVGTDANIDRLNKLENGYFLHTPSSHLQMDIEVAKMDELVGDFDLIITSVGRQHLDKVAAWLEKKKFLAPVLLAENLPDPVTVFPRQIPIVVDRICPRVTEESGALTVFAEDYYKIVVLDDSLTHQLWKVDGIGLENTEAEVEEKRRQKMFTVNLSHLITALYGQKLGLTLVEEAIGKSEVVSMVSAIITEVGPWLNMDGRQISEKKQQIIERFSSPLQDPLSRIFEPSKKISAMRYIEVPLNGLHEMGLKAPALEEAFNLINY